MNMEREGVITGDMRGHVAGGGGTGPRRVGLYVRNQQKKYSQERPATAGQPGLDRRGRTAVAVQPQRDGHYKFAIWRRKNLKLLTYSIKDQNFKIIRHQRYKTIR